jgi:hypothetical protein
VNGTIAAVMGALIAVLVAIGLLTGESSSSSKSPAAAAPAGPSIPQIARKVEQVRELRFKALPPVRRVTNVQARADALHELDEEAPPRELAQAQELLKLLRLIPANASLRKLMGKAFGSEVGGYYVPRTGKLSVVGGGGGLLREVTLAHELTHALEDQHFDLDRDTSGLLDDRSSADAAVREGSATVVMVDYVILKQTGQLRVPEALRQRVLSALDDAAVPPSSGLPRYLRDSLVFPYPAGARLIDRVQQRGGWAAVNRLYGPDAPVSSEQVMHPAKRHDPPVRVRIPGAANASMHGDFGEFDTRELLLGANGAATASRAAAGWGGGAFALFPDRLVMTWTWDTPRDASEFWTALRHTARDLHGTASRSGGTTSLTIAR